MALRGILRGLKASFLENFSILGLACAGSGYEKIIQNTDLKCGWRRRGVALPCKATIKIKINLTKGGNNDEGWINKK